MKKIYKILLIILVIVLIIACVLVVYTLAHRLDLSKLTVSDVESITLYSYYHGETATLDDENVADVVSALNDVRSYKYASKQYEHYAGMGCNMFSINLQNGKSLLFTASNPFYIVNGKCWFSDYSTCDSVYHLWIDLVDEYFGLPESP